MWPTVPHDKLLPWLITRFRNQPAPPGTPSPVPKYWWGVAKWIGWRRKLAQLLPGEPAPPRPISTDKAPIPDKIPSWAWGLYRAVAIAVPLKPPPPPPPPPNPIPPNSWKLRFPVMFTSWGTNPAVGDWREAHDFEAFLQRCVDAHVGTVLLQIGLYARTGDYPQRVRDRGLDLALWTPVAQDRDEGWVNDANAEGYVPQIEGSGEYVAAVAQLRKPVWGERSLSVVTTNSGLDHFIHENPEDPNSRLTTVEAEELTAAGCTHHLVECYDGDMQPMDVGNKMWANTRCGAYYNNPVAGLADRLGVTLASNDPDLAVYGRQFGVYLAEPMRASDWADLRAR